MKKALSLLMIVVLTKILLEKKGEKLALEHYLRVAAKIRENTYI